ncbi:hypothetical protein ORI20_27685 [Mycobacterium sp. CVI_P3]|uniref:Lipoprotein n=1 Tax=Mycobacterium pinniadriaticum TaxID=2994102 RepID=A0ABT3SMS8_9MYCO|nr:hypothetical protein [Mycobacterium pinniadriaticum]MCX2934054.1 hypothetical protein [Mycobacterium pinniadriaticum]MCX2940449.1 hypothetical protein [Mycobacterium pinniadriaticum]
MGDAVKAARAAMIIYGTIAAMCVGCIPAPGGSRATVTVTKTSIYTPPASAPITGSDSGGWSPGSTSQTSAGPATSIVSDGTYVVGVDIAPGIYRSAGSNQPGYDCYWKRLASFDSSDIIDNEGSEGPQVVEIMASDKAFSTARCKPWIRANG